MPVHEQPRLPSSPAGVGPAPFPTARRPSTGLLALAALAAFSLAPQRAQGQGVAELLESVRRGGGWVALPIEGGHGRVRTLPLPTLGLELVGCARVWGGHSGRWSVRARDVIGDGEISVDAEPGEAVPFSYRTGMQAQLDVEVRWSEPRDTTFLLWVGLETPAAGERDACEPIWGRSGG